jgi:hypothetical protein
MGETKYLKQLVNEVRIKEVWPVEELTRKIDSKIEWAEKEEHQRKVEEVEINDFFSYSVAKVPHPCVIFAMDEHCVWGIITSTNSSGCHNISPIEGSRLLGKGWWTNTIICTTKDAALKHWLGIFDNPPEIRRAVKLLEEYYKKLLI